MGAKLSVANRYLRNPATRERTVVRSVATSSAVEGVRAPFKRKAGGSYGRAREVPNATTQAAILEARQVRARYDAPRDLVDGLKGEANKKKRTHKAAR